MKKNPFFYWTVSRSTCILNALFVLGVGLPQGKAADNVFRHDGKTKIRAASVVKESRVLDKLQRVEKELEDIRKERLALREERDALERERSRMRQEFIETKERYRSLEDMYRRLQLNAATMVDAPGKTEGAARELELLDALRHISGNSQNLTLRIAEFCDFISSVMDSADIDQMDKARIRYRLNLVRAELVNASAVAEQYSRKTIVTECRILAVDTRLRVVILSAGTVQGVRNGLNWFSGRDRSCRLQVVAVRPHLAAALIVEGNINQLAPGMQAFTGSGKKQQ